MIRFGICDDDEAFAEVFIEELTAECKRQVPDEEIVCIFYNDADSAINRALEDGIDIYIIDVEYGEYSGTEVAKRLHGAVRDAGISYITNYDQYAASCYVCRPLGFIRKKCLDRDLYIATKTFIEYVEDMYAVGHFGGSKSEVDIRLTDIVYFQIYGHKVEIEIAGGKRIIVRDTISNIENQVLSHDYVKVNRSCIVNLRYVKAVQGEDVILADGTKLQISGGKSKQIHNSLILFLSRRG